LCIIQDSLADWQIKCPQMCNVYKRSYCNIAATSATDDTEGCFWKRDIDFSLLLRIQFGTSTTDLVEDRTNIIATNLGEESLLGAYDICNDQTWMADVRDSVLNTRGWVLQKRMISQRVLNFTYAQMYWQCDELQASESYPYGFPAEDNADVFFKSHNPFRIQSQTTEKRHERAFETWGRAVQAYTVGQSYNAEDDLCFGKNLTNASDKLVAFSVAVNAV
jgi:hypothetical protein